jgi:hypothetical protein
MKAKCARCTWDSQGINAGFIRGLCVECSADIIKKARRRGIYLIVRGGESPPPSKRERKVDGITLWWWKGQWRIQ